MPVAVIRGNASEIKTLVLGSAGARGVDADITDQVTQENLEATAALAQTLAGKTGAVVALTGAVDVVTDGDKAVFIRNGHPMMCRLTGMGCQLSALTAAFVAANRTNLWKGRRRRLRHGALRRNGLCPAVRAGRDGFLWGCISWTPFPPDAGGAGEREPGMRCDRKTMRLYAVTDRAWVGQGTLGIRWSRPFRGGVTCVQLREKSLGVPAILVEAEEIGALCRSYGVPFLINDCVEIALQCGADGVHVGQKGPGPPGRSDACWDLTGFWAYPPGLWSKRCRRSGTARIIWGSAQFFHLHQGGCHAGVL